MAWVTLRQLATSTMRSTNTVLLHSSTLMKRTIVAGSKDFRCPTVGGTVGTIETMGRLWQEHLYKTAESELGFQRDNWALKEIRGGSSYRGWRSGCPHVFERHGPDAAHDCPNGISASFSPNATSAPN
jgi:hypothetical protein